jgi:hypothetical protein
MSALDGEPVYASDPEAAPDSAFVPGELAHLVPGNRGRLLDTRRTPVRITEVRPEIGAFELEVLAFEDAGARWQLALQEVSRFQFGAGAGAAPPDTVARLVEARARFAQPIHVACDAAQRERTLHRLASGWARAKEWLAGRGLPRPGRLDTLTARGEGDPELFGALEAYLLDHGVADIETELTRVLVSNPSSGEVVKGHAIVLAELGLCPYDGPPVRDPATFEAPWDRARRAEHLLARMAFTQALWSEHEMVELYRGAAVDGPLPDRTPASLISATFSRRVATEHFEGGPTTRTAVLWRQRVPINRLIMTFAETRAFNDRFREAEAVLIGDPANRAF